MPWAVVPAASLPVFGAHGDATVISSRGVDEEQSADYFPPADRRVSPEIRGNWTI